MARRILIFLTCLIVSGCASHGDKSAPFGGSAATPSIELSDKKAAALGAKISTLNTQSLIAITGDRVLYSYGDVSDTGYVASVRKSILAILYGPYVENGTIDLDATLSEIGIDDIDGLLDIEKKARVRDLISARSGVYHPAANGGDSTGDAPPRGSKEPGSYFLYNNWDFNAAGGVFELLTGLSVYDALEKDLAGPLGFQDFDRSYQELHGDGAKSQFLAYHMFLSARDLARVGLLMLNKGEWEGRRLISENWVRAITSSVTQASEMNPERERNGEFDYGYMWWVFTPDKANKAFKGAYLAQGSYGQYLLVIPALNMVIAHKTKYRPVSSREEYDSVSVSFEQFKEIVGILIGGPV